MERYEDSKLYKIRHSAAHIMAQAVMEMFPGEVGIAIGPPIEDGFYYDFDLPRNLTPEDLEKIEVRMREIVKANQKFVRREVSAAEARQQFKDQPYKLELIDGLEKGGLDEYGSSPGAPTTGGNPLKEKPVISFYVDGPFVDLCRGPHLESTSQINPAALKLMNVAGAYWRGDEKNKMLQRIYGTAWETAEQLEQYLWRLEEAKKRDHRKLGQELGIFMFSPDVGKGLPLWLPRGAILRDTLERYLRQEQIDRGYLPVVTPHIAKIDLYKISGHWYKYRESMYAPMMIDDEEFILKPMNCPHHIQIYKAQPRSYRDLPVRLAEFGTVYRYENSGNLTGLTRVRGFTVDDSHMFVTPEQLEHEFIGVVDLIMSIFKAMNFKDYKARLGVRDPKSDKYAGTDEMWQRAEAAIKHAADQTGLPYTVEEGEGAFYGPKLDFIFRDVIGREWQLGTVQIDYYLPQQFELEYKGEDGQMHRPIMIHRAPFGSLERFIAILIEHYAGAFPVWLSPTQAMIIPIADRHVAYAKEVAKKLKVAGIRSEVDESTDRMQAKIRNAQLLKIPYMLVVGDKEQEAGAVAIRLRSGEDLKAKPLTEFIEIAKKAIESKE